MIVEIVKTGYLFHVRDTNVNRKQNIVTRNVARIHPRYTASRRDSFETRARDQRTDYIRSISIAIIDDLMATNQTLKLRQLESRFVCQHQI